MTSDIVNGICRTLHKAVPEAEIYTESAEQGLSPPCFSVAALESSDTQKLGTRRFRQYPYVVHYFPATDSPKQECRSILDKLYECMQHICADCGLIRGDNLHAAYEDAVLHFYATYKLFIRTEKTPERPMERLELEEHIT